MKFEVSPPFTSVEIAVSDHLVRLKAGQVYETSDPREIEALEAHHAITRVRSKAAS